MVVILVILVTFNRDHFVVVITESAPTVGRPFTLDLSTSRTVARVLLVIRFNVDIQPNRATHGGAIPWHGFPSLSPGQADTPVVSKTWPGFQILDPRPRLVLGRRRF